MKASKATGGHQERPKNEEPTLTYLSKNLAPSDLPQIGQVLSYKVRNRKPIPSPGLSFKGLDRFPDNCQPHEDINYLEECKG